MLVDLVVDRNLTGATVKVSWRGQGLPTSIQFADRRVTIAKAQSGSAPTWSLPPQAYENQPRLAVSAALASALRLPVRARLCLDEGEGHWRFGPCLALYAHEFPQRERRFGEQSTLFADLAVKAWSYGVDVVVIGPGFRTAHRGLRYDPDRRRWLPCQVPTPDVVLRRSGSFPMKQMGQVRADLAWFSSTGRLHTLPASCSNKFLFYKFLQNSPELRAYAPYSTVATSAGQVWNVLTQRANVYVKPVSGAQGASVVHLMRSGKRVTAAWEERNGSGQNHTYKGKMSNPVTQPQSQVRTRTALQVRVQSTELSNFSEFVKFWRRTGLRRCVIQDTVALPKTSAGRPFDLRWLLQCCDEPKIVARVARVGQPGAVTTNIHTGGEAVDATWLLRDKFGATQATEMLRNLDDAAVGVAQELRRRFGGFAEAGLDMALVGHDQIAVFEVNPTPGRRMLRQLSTELREMSLGQLLEYAMRATGFSASLDKA